MIKKMLSQVLSWLNRKKSCLLIPISFFGGLSIIVAQQINLIRYTAEDGLPSSNIYQVIQDKQGYIWVGTDKGVSRFDGYQFQNFTIQDGLPNNDVWGIREDDAGRIWFGTFNQLAYYENGEIKKIPYVDSSQFVAPMVVAHWPTEDKIFALLREDNLNFFLEIDEKLGTQKIIKEGLDHICYLGQKENKRWFFNLSLKKQSYISFIPVGTDNEVRYLDIDIGTSHLLGRKMIQCGNKAIFFTRESILEFDFKTLKTTSITSILGKDVIIEDVFPGNSQYEQLILLKTNIGYKILDRNLKPLQLLNPSDIFFKSILEDRNGNIWLAAADGLYLLTSNARFSKNYTLSTSEKSNKCTAIFVAPNNTIWAGNQKNEIWKIADGIKTSISLLQKNYTNIPITHISKWQNHLVAAGDFGIFLLSEEDLTQKEIQAYPFSAYTKDPIINYFPINGNFLAQPIKSISTTNDCLLMAQWNGVGLLCNQQQKLEVERLTTNRAYTASYDVKGGLWIGKKDGLWYQDKETLTFLGEQYTLLKHPINDLKIDKQGNLWIATDGYGILYFNHQTVEVIAISKNSIPKQLFIDKDNQIWVATNRGIARISLKNEVSFQYDYQQITTAHGLASSEVNQVFVKDSMIYAATNSGLTLIDYKEKFAQTRPTLTIQKIGVNNTTLPYANHYELTHQENNLKIEYVCLSYESRKQISYQYKMSPIDTAWQTTAALVREYPQLATGNYTFQLKAADIDGNFSELKAIQFTIHPPWWETTWFKVLAGLSLIGFIILYFQIRIRAIKRKEASKTRINKKFAELELQALQAQMNPHFIFNSMNAIQNFIYTQEKRAAGKYIVKFSRLMRLFLNASNQKYSTLEQEIEILQKYVELEKLRFDDKFDYEFIIDPTLSLASTKIPALLLQPYVENAINHGLVHRSSKGNLWIRFYKKSENRLLCEIEDNGIGRAKAMEIRQQSFKKHQPRGMALVEERQRVMNFIDEQDIKIEITDLKDKQQSAIGTKVSVTLPINKG